MSGASARWRFTDSGEPGGNDQVTIVIAGRGSCNLSVTGNLDRGNHQVYP